MTITATPDTLKEKVRAFEILFEKLPLVTAIGPFTDEDGDSIFGFVEVVKIGRTRVMVEADGVRSYVTISSVVNGFYLR